MGKAIWKERLPGIIGTVLITLVTALWTFWGAAEMYYEGWGQPFPLPLAYLIPAATCMLLTALVLAWPRAGGWLLIGGGALFTAWVLSIQISRAGGVQPLALLSFFPVTALIVVVGILFVIEGQRRRRTDRRTDARWFVRHLRYLVALGVPLLVLLIISAAQLPVVLTRFDDGDRGARRIEGNGVTLIWAPSGPGWNWQQPAGWNPSWDRLARYGLPPVGLKDAQQMEGHATEADMREAGLCHYLSADGRTLLDTPQDVWRMPTTDELVRSLVRGGEHAGCTWDGTEGRVDCHVRPDKELPLWAPEQSAIYYWSADAYDAEKAWYVSYNGHVSRQPKDWGNPRHGHRCVREP